MDGVKSSKTPMSTTTKLDKDENGKPVDDYLTASRPDIIFATCLCARFQSSLKEFHLNAIKRILNI